MRWLAFFTDTADTLGCPKTKENIHTAYLKRHRDELPMYGGCRETVSGILTGEILVLDGVSRERTIALIGNDPYFVPEQLRYRLLTWVQACTVNGAVGLTESQRVGLQ